MKKLWKWLITLLIIAALAFALYRRGVGIYNNLVKLDEWVKGAWAQVENQYQRRADLIPSLVEVVKWYADQEYSVLTEVTNARSKATQMTVDVKDAKSMAEYQAAQGGLSSALSRLMVANERYPELKSDQRFAALQTQIEGTENRITTERGRFNEIVRQFNTTVRTFPTSIIANIFKFDKANLFSAEAWSEKAPEVKFDFSNRKPSSENTPTAEEKTKTPVVENTPAAE